MPLPESIIDERQLDQLLADPSPRLLDFVSRIASPLILFGAGGKMGPTLALLALQAAKLTGHRLEIITVSRFQNAETRTWLEAKGIQTVPCDLLDADAVMALPDSENVIYLVGQKFGTTQSPASTWAMNTLVPDRVIRRYRHSRMVALSTANVYPLSPVARGGSLEEDPLTPLGEYPNAAVGRERILQFHAQQFQTPLAILRLSYAVELRYGVLFDIARAVWEQQPLDVTNGYFHCIWQGDANEMILRALGLATVPDRAWNLCRPEVQSVREIALQLGELMGRQPVITGTESTHALLANPQRICAQLGEPMMALEPLLGWTADWVKRGRAVIKQTDAFRGS